jgi:hypothetical protein
MPLDRIDRGDEDDDDGDDCILLSLPLFLLFRFGYINQEGILESIPLK